MIYIVMGVSGCGKSSLGALLSEKVYIHTQSHLHHVSAHSMMQHSLFHISTHQLGWPLHEGDTFHPHENIEKMARGEPLTYQDRLPWLLKLHEEIERHRCSGTNAVVVCSALNRLYRQILLHGSKALAPSYGPGQEGVLPPASPDVVFVFLQGDYDLLHQRMVARRGHYMKAELLHSQFDVLEPPSDEENVLRLDIRRSVPDLAVEVEKHAINLKSSPTH